MDWTEVRKRINELPSCPAGIKKDFIVRRSITEIEGKPHVETYSESELVRCKDCKYKQKSYVTDRQWWCNRLEKHCDDDWFCADGERKDT